MDFKRISTVFILFLLSSMLFAQETKQTKYPFNQLRLSVTPSLCSSLKINHEGGVTIFKSNPTLGAEATISYYQHIVNGLGVSLGVGINSTAYSYSFSFAPHVTYPIQVEEKIYQPTGMITVPLALNMMIPIKSSSWNVDIQAGARLNYLFNSGSESVFTDDIGMADFRNIKELPRYWVEVKRDTEIAFSYFLKAGVTYTTKRNNAFFCNIMGNYSPKEALTGNYILRTSRGVSYGSFKQTLNYLGLEVGYALTLCKKR